jgi:hypothetical protein
MAASVPIPTLHPAVTTVRNTSLAWILRFVACGLALAILAGCGPKSDRLRIHGTVALDGQPLDKGSIRFTPATPTSGEQSLSAGAMIRDGEFDIPQEQGLPPGTYRVSISSPDTSGKKVPYSPGQGAPTIMVAPDRIPVSYNMNSEHTIDLEASGKHDFEFDIRSAE